jgi:hypothetical protein
MTSEEKDFLSRLADAGIKFIVFAHGNIDLDVDESNGL